MPQRLTVAGEATFRSCTSNIMCSVEGSLMRSATAPDTIVAAVAANIAWNRKSVQ